MYGISEYHQYKDDVNLAAKDGQKIEDIKDNYPEDIEKAKNVKQTEIMIRLRDAILRVSRYFQVNEYNMCMTNLLPGKTPCTKITES